MTIDGTKEPDPTGGPVKRKQSVERPTWTVTLPTGWARAGLVGIEGALFGWAVPALIASLSYLVLSGNPWWGDITLGDAGRLGTDFWALSLGAPMTFAGLPVTLIPLFWTATQVLLLRALMIRGGRFDAAAQWAAVPLFVLTTLLIVTVSGETASPLQVLPGAIIASFVATLWAVISQTPTWPPSTVRLRWLWSGISAGLVWLLAVFVVGFGAVIASLVASWSAVTSGFDLLGATGISSIALILLQVAYLPVFAAWALAYLSGAGFYFIGGQIEPNSVLTLSSEPVLPVVGLLPTTTFGSTVIWALIAAGFVLGLGSAFKWMALPFLAAILRALTASVSFTLGLFVWFWLSEGALGVDRLSFLGPAPTAWLFVSVQVAGVALLLVLLLHPATFASVKTALKFVYAAAFSADEPGEDKTGEVSAQDNPEKTPKFNAGPLMQASKGSGAQGGGLIGLEQASSPKSASGGRPVKINWGYRNDQK